MKTYVSYLWIVAVIALPVVASDTAKPTLEERKIAALHHEAKYGALRREAFGQDFDRAMAAIDKMAADGDAARFIIQSAVAEWLDRDQRQIQARLTALGASTDIRKHEAAIVEVQAEARANIAVLEKGETVAKAHELYKKLEELHKPLETYYGSIVFTLDAMNRRPQLLALWERYKTASDTRFNAEAESALLTQVESTIGMTLAEGNAIREAGRPTQGGVASQSLFAHFLRCRRIEAYNDSVSGDWKPAELQNAKKVNHYRERLGLELLEFDARLMKAARAHSEEMKTLGYFSHESPVEENKDFGKRARNFGYQGATGENIAAGTSSGTRAFWMWFDSPGHHKNMAGGHNALGVGQAAEIMTQNFGGGPRQMDSTATAEAE